MSTHVGSVFRVTIGCSSRTGKDDRFINICTRNRADSLRETLASLARVRVPTGVECELVVVDNGSTDETAQVVREADLPQMTSVRLVCESLPGLSRARNRAIAESRGEILLCAADVILPPDWIEGMIAPIVEGRAQAVAGGIAIAPHLMRPWMKSHHKMWLASTYHYKPDAPTSFIGANMALSRAVLDKVPSYDLELGPGQIGLGDDTLFAEHLKRAGFVIAGALDVAVEHHFDASRLQRQSLLTSKSANVKVCWSVRDWAANRSPISIIIFIT